MDQKSIYLEGLKASKVRVSNLLSILEHPSNIKVLSLDCFDTLLWRKTATPFDMFYLLQNKPMFTQLGLNATFRANAEALARQIKILNEQGSEVTLDEIYLAYNHELTSEQLTALAEEEISLEIEMCYVHPQMLELIRRAVQLNIKIIVVSDTYYQVNQLHKLLSSVLSADMMSHISAVFCSCEYQRSKVNGLFNIIIKSLGAHPESILHLGDSLAADYISARTSNIKAVHFVQDNEEMININRLQAIVANVIDPAVRSTQPLFNPFKGVYASQSFTSQPESLLGYATLGSLMYTFALYIQAKVKDLTANGKKPKVLFLLRDAHLPALAYETLTGETAYRVKISRYSALAASFRTQQDVDHYLLTVVHSKRFKDVTRQLLLPEKVSTPLIATAEKSENPVQQFVRLIHRNDILRIIFKRSQQYSKRLLTYLQKQTHFTENDDLLFVDLGYSGTVQNRLTPIFKELNITLHGCYFIAMPSAVSTAHRHGLLDISWCDTKLLSMLVAYIALFEQLCTANEGSVIDYDEKGNEISSDVEMSTKQHTMLTNIQSECIRFVKDAKYFFDTSKLSISWQALRETARIELTRLLFLPTSFELHCLQSFQFDINMGTKDVYRLFDKEQGLAGLRRRGLFYMEKSSHTHRTNYPAELRTAGFELAMTSMIQNRLGLDLKPQDMLLREEIVPVFMVQGLSKDQVDIEATITHDGYFALSVPVGDSVTLLLGQKYKWLQIDSAELILTEAFVNQSETNNKIDAWQYVSSTSLINRDNDLFECLSNDASLKLELPQNKVAPGTYVFRIIFRPIVFKKRIDIV